MRQFAHRQDPVALSKLGKDYLRSRPEENSVEELLRLMLADGDETCAVRLHRAIARDWQEQDVVALDGWVSSRTEARLCAFCYLDGHAA